MPPFATVSALARLTAPPTLRTEEMVVEPVTARLVDVAPCSDVAPETVSEERVVAPAVTVPSVAPPVALN